MKRILVALSLAAAAPAFAVDASAPYEQVDRLLPTVPARSDGGASTSSRTHGNVWTGDHNFIAPAQ